MHTEAEYARLAEALAEAQKLVQILGGQRDDNLIASANANARALRERGAGLGAREPISGRPSRA